MTFDGRIGLPAVDSPAVDSSVGRANTERRYRDGERIPVTGRRATRPGVRCVLAMAILAAAAGCGGGSSPAATRLRPAVTFGQLTVGGVQRTYRVYAPPTSGPRPPSALVVVLHGGAATVDDAVATTMFDQAAAANDFIVAYPQGTREEWNAGFCCGSAPARMVDDVGFLDSLSIVWNTTFRSTPSGCSLSGCRMGP